ncbi:MAG: helix-turn-helix domain-containing protein [Parasporobacterium sp.]|nr:helix-turn-helix domain-containing protein [Parasporobacterium sp.]
MELSKITSKLGKYHPKQLASFDSNVDIFFFQLSEKEKSFEQNALYICNVSELPRLPLEHGLSFLCIKDIDVPKEYLNPENELNLVTIDRVINAYDAIGILSRIFSNDSRVSSARNRLINALHSGKGLQYIVNEAFSLLQNPVIVSDIGYKILAMCKDESYKGEAALNIDVDSDKEQNPDIKSTQNYGYLIESETAINKRERIHEKIRESRYPYFSNDDESDDFGRVTSLVYIHGIEIAEVSVIGTRHQIDDVDIETIDFLCKIISLELQKDEFYSSNPGLMHSYLLSDLLKGQIKSREVADARMQNLGWNLHKNLIIMIVSDFNRDIFEGKAQIISKQLHDILATSRWVIFDGRIIFLMSFKEHPALSSNQRLVEYLEKNNLVASLSASFTDIMDIQKYYLQAKKAFEIGIKVSKGKYIYNYGDFVIYHMGDIISRTNNLEDFYHPGVVAVREYDKKHGSNFLETLELYLEYVDKTEAIAKKLYIHKNTVLYRINKLKEQFGLDLSTGEERLKLLLTIKLMKLEQ